MNDMNYKKENMGFSSDYCKENLPDADECIQEIERLETEAENKAQIFSDRAALKNADPYRRRSKEEYIPLTRAQLAVLAEKYRNTDDMEVKKRIWKIIADFLGAHVGREVRRIRGTGDNDPENDDYCQEAMINIFKHFHEYQPKYGSPITYFDYIIKNAVSQYNKDQHPVTTAYFSGHDKKVKRAKAKLEQEGIPVTTLQLSFYTGLTGAQVEAALNRLDNMTPLSLESITDKDAQSGVYPNPEQMVLQSEISKCLRDAFYSLTQDERNVIVMCYGLADTKKKSIAKVAAALDMSPSKVRSIKASAYEGDPVMSVFNSQAAEYALIDDDELFMNTSDSGEQKYKIEVEKRTVGRNLQRNYQNCYHFNRRRKSQDRNCIY